MKRISSLAAIALVMSSLSGCYLGSSRGGKTVAYGTNIGVTGLGLLAMAEANGDEAEIMTTLALIPIVLGITGILINYATDTDAAPATSSPSPMPGAVRGPPPFAITTIDR